MSQRQLAFEHFNIVLLRSLYFTEIRLMKLLTPSAILLFLVFQCQAQMNFESESLYGNEWIDYDKTYLKFTINEDQVYQITYADLIESGVPSQIKGNEFQLYSLGKKIPIYVSTDEIFSEGDFILFYGQKNRGELDQTLFRDWENEQINPYYSMFTDDRSYFLCWGIEPQNQERYESIENNISNNLPPAEDFYQHEETYVFNDFHLRPILNGADVRYSNFTTTEGFGSNLKQVHSINFSCSQIFEGSPNAYIDFRIGTNPFNHTIQSYFNDSFIESFIQNGDTVRQIQYEIPTSDLKSNNLFELIDQNQNAKNSIAKISLSYPRKFVANNENYFKIPFRSHSFPKYFELSSFQTNGEIPKILDVSNKIILDGIYEDNLVKFALPGADLERNMIVFTKAKEVKDLEEIRFRNLENLSPSYVIFTSSHLDQEDEAGINWIQEYQEFRSSENGGSYKVEVIHSEEIIDQFGYGIKNHSIGIKNWSNYFDDRWPDWNFTFIIGKGIQYGLLRTNPDSINYVPTWGEPGSDNLCFAKGNNSFPEMGIGRLAAKSPIHIKSYLEKQLKYLENFRLGQSIEDRYWMKQVIQLSGGDPNVENAIKNALQEMKDTIQNSLFGADIFTFSKTSTNEVQSAQSEGIIKRVNEGCSIITFFGHSAIGVVDFGLEDPSQYDNEGRTPLIISLGCHSGNIHTTAANGISEDFVLVPEKGAIAFYASSGVAFVPAQELHGIKLYDLLGNEMYGKELGLIQKRMLEEINTNGSFDMITLQQQLTLHGDPATKIYSSPSPDYTPDLASFRTVPEIVSGRLDSIDICFDIVNLGRYSDERIPYSLIHSHSNKRDTFYYTTNGIHSRKNLCHTIPINIANDIGENLIEVFLDYKQEIEELPQPQAELNNSLIDAYQIPGFSFFVLNDNPIPYYPHEFAITNEDQITLQASTGNGFIGTRDYIVEIDTTELFNSPLKLSIQKEYNGGLVKWTPEIEYKDQQVYYWRVRVADPENGITLWNSSSFVHLDAYDYGWNQSHFYQFLKDDFTTIKVDSTTRDFEYIESDYEYDILNVKRTINSFSEFRVNSSFTELHSFADIQAGVFIGLIHPTSFKLFTCPIGGTLGADEIWENRERNLWPFKTNTEEDRQQLIAFLSLPEFDDYYIIMFTVQDEFKDCEPEEWSDELFEIFENEGATQIRELVGNPRPYIFAYQKGHGFIDEAISNHPDEALSRKIVIEGKWFQGKIKSNKIGPAKAWTTMLWNKENFNNNEDSLFVNLYGVNHNDKEELLAKEILLPEFDLSFINAETHPEIFLELYSKDTVSLTSPDLGYWRVLYQALPDAVFNANEGFVFESDTLLRGQDLKLNYTIDNASKVDLDSLLIHYALIDSQNNEILSTKKKAPIKGKESLPDEFTYNTTNLKGKYQFVVELNPNQDQSELYDFNNIGIINFLVKVDNINPLLDVTFDGIRILEGDIVSPKPLIKISLTDEDPLLLLNNIEDFFLTLEYPDGTIAEVALDDTSVNFIPAEEDQSSNTACIEFSPTLSEGNYTLNVQAKDATGNFSGDHAYSISFEVIEDNKISRVINYPNPFSTSTEFIFWLTGDLIPNNYHIKIMTLSGKVVKEISQMELGPIRVGINRSAIKWNGTDDYGQKLANGVYLYRFYSDLDQELDNIEIESIDHFYKDGFGKLVIMR